MHTYKHGPHSLAWFNSFACSTFLSALLSNQAVSQTDKTNPILLIIFEKNRNRDISFKKDNQAPPPYLTFSRKGRQEWSHALFLLFFNMGREMATSTLPILL